MVEKHHVSTQLPGQLNVIVYEYVESIKVDWSRYHGDMLVRIEYEQSRSFFYAQTKRPNTQKNPEKAQIAMNILPVTALLANYPTSVTIYQHIHPGWCCEWI